MSHGQFDESQHGLFKESPHRYRLSSQRKSLAPASRLVWLARPGIPIPGGLPLSWNGDMPPIDPAVGMDGAAVRIFGQQNVSYTIKKVSDGTFLTQTGSMDVTNYLGFTTFGPNSSFPYEDSESNGFIGDEFFSDLPFMYARDGGSGGTTDIGGTVTAHMKLLWTQAESDPPLTLFEYEITQTWSGERKAQDRFEEAFLLYGLPIFTAGGAHTGGVQGSGDLALTKDDGGNVIDTLTPDGAAILDSAIFNATYWSPSFAPGTYGCQVGTPGGRGYAFYGYRARFLQRHNWTIFQNRFDIGGNPVGSRVGHNQPPINPARLYTFEAEHALLLLEPPPSQ